MNDHGRKPIAQADYPPEVADAEFHSATPRQSVGLVGLRHKISPEEIANDRDCIDRPSTDADLLQFFLAIESSRQEMETYNRYLNTVVRQTAQARMDAEAAARLKSDFLATMSHEMRTPLNGIIGMTSVLLSRDLDELERDYLETIRQAGEALRAIVNDVLDLSKIEAGKLRLERADFDLPRTFSDALQIIQGTIHQKSLHLAIRHDARLPRWVRGDAGRINQVLLNLLSNAVKFTDRGKIEISTRVQFLDADDCEVLISVKDEGIGITDDQQRNLFQPFNQAECSTTRKYGGTGLGLAISKRLTELMGGQIGVSSRYGEGSLFWFSVRLQVAQEPTVTAERESNAFGSSVVPRDNRILVVEDNKINQKVALLMLKGLGYSADIAANGLEALSALDSAHYDLILMDCMMPEMDGFEATRRLRSFGGHSASVPVIAMTASAFDDDRVACLSAGMNDFISKPVYEAELSEKLSFWLRTERRSAV